METTQPGCAAAGSEGMGTDDTTLTERVEPSSFVAAGDRLLVHLNSSLQYCMLWRYPDSRKVLMFLWRSQNR